MMYLMEGRKLLDVNVFDGQQENAKHIVTNIVVPRIFGIFISFHSFILTSSSKAHIQQVCIVKKDSQSDRNKEFKVMKEERDFFVCML